MSARGPAAGLAEPHGDVAPGWEPVREAFAAILRDPGERGAGLHVVHAGESVVDLHGGAADDWSGRPYTGDTRQVVFSASKGVVAICLGVLVERGELDLDAPVARYWPQFGRAGKERMTVAQVLSHQAGLPAPASPTTVAAVLAGEPLAELLAAQQPLWRTGHGYHVVTWGTLAGELVRRTTGASLGAVLDELVVRPLGLDLTFGNSPGRPIAPVVAPDRIPLPSRLLTALALRRGTLFRRSITVGGVLTDPSDALVRRPDVLAAELPAANVVTTARSLAQLYGALLPGAGTPLLRAGTVSAITRGRAAGRDRVVGIDSAFGCGFALPSPLWRLGSPTAFGHPGIGGAVGLADPRRDLAFAFLPRTLPAAPRDPRDQALLTAVAEVIGR